MVLIDSVKYACATCIKGHRSSSCTHESRPLFEIKKKGRPVTQCVHCRELRKTKQVHVKCLCEVKPEQSTVTPILLAPDHSIIPATPSTGSCNCKDKSQEGICICCTPRHPSAKHNTPHQAGGEHGISSGSGTSHTSLHRPHISTTVSTHDGLQRSSSLSSSHAVQQHHPRHFAPYKLPSRSPPPDSADNALDADLVPSSRNRSQSSASHPEFDRATTGEPFFYNNPTRTVSNPDLTWLTANPPSTLVYPNQTSGSGDECYPFDLSDLEYSSNERMDPLQLSSNSADSRVNDDPLAMPQKPAYPLPQLCLDDADATRDPDLIPGSYIYETLVDVLSTPQPAHRLSPFSSGPPSMSGSTSRSSSRNSGGHHDVLLEGSENVQASEDGLRGRSGRQERTGSASSPTGVIDSQVSSQLNESPTSYLPKFPNSYDQTQYSQASSSWPPVPESDGSQFNDPSYSFRSGGDDLTIMGGAMPLPMSFTDYPDGFFSFDQFSVPSHNGYIPPFYPSFPPSLPWSD